MNSLYFVFALTSGPDDNVGYFEDIQDLSWSGETGPVTAVTAECGFLFRARPLLRAVQGGRGGGWQLGEKVCGWCCGEK